MKNCFFRFYYINTGYTYSTAAIMQMVVVKG